MDNLKREKTFVVSLKGLGPWVSAIRYEKDQKDVKLFVTLAKETLPGRQAGQPAVIVENIQLGGKLSEKMFQNLEYHQQGSLYVSILSQQDFKECDASAKNLKDCLEDLKSSMLDLSFLLLAQEPLAASPRGFLWTQRPGLREKMTATFPSETKGSWVLLRITENLLAAKEHILSLTSKV